MRPVCPKCANAQIGNTRPIIEARDEAQPLQRNVWAISCLGLVLTSWALLAYLALADAILSGDTASDSAFVPVYLLLGLVTLAALVFGIAALEAISKRGQAWLAWAAFGLALVPPAIYAITVLSLLLSFRDGLFPSPD